MTPKTRSTELKNIKLLIAGLSFKPALTPNQFKQYHKDIENAELKGITETNTKWKDAVSKLKEIIGEWDREELFRGGVDSNVLFKEIDNIFKELTNDSPKNKTNIANDDAGAQNESSNLDKTSDTQSNQKGDEK